MGQQPHGMIPGGWENLYRSHPTLPPHWEGRAKAAQVSCALGGSSARVKNPEAMTCIYSIAATRWVLRLLNPFSARQLPSSMNFSYVILPVNSTT